MIEFTWFVFSAIFFVIACLISLYVCVICIGWLIVFGNRICESKGTRLPRVKSKGLRGDWR